MRIIQTLALTFIALPLLAATCVTETQQKGPAGPWVGEVRNTGTDVVSDSLVRGDVTDATGFTFSFSAPTCPTRLAPGEVATWEVFTDGLGLVPPLTGTFHAESTAGDSGVINPGLTVRLIEASVAQRAVAISIENPTEYAIGGISVCGSAYLPDGQLTEVGKARVVPSQLSPGESVTAVVYFASLVPDATFDFDVRGSRDCCNSQNEVDGEHFRIVTTQLVNAGFSDYPGVTRGITVVGELRTGNHDLIETRMSAHIAGDPLYRDDRITVGCAGTAKRDEVAPVMFTLPLPPGADERDIDITINGAAGFASTGEPFVRLPVRNLHVDEFMISGEIVNNTSTWMRVPGTCFTVRDGSRLAGSASISTEYYLAPGATQSVSASVGFIGDPTDYEIIAYAEPLPGGPPTPISAP